MRAIRSRLLVDGQATSQAESMTNSRSPIADSRAAMLTISPMQPADWPAVRRIYAEGIATGRATFDTEIPDWEAWNAGHLAQPRLVARQDGEVVGWAAL